MTIYATNDSVRLWRYVIVKGISKSLEVGIPAAVLWLSGSGQIELVIYTAVLMSSLLDFVLQKVWAFRKTIELPKHFYRDLCLYVLLRLSNAALAFGLWHLFDQVIQSPKVVTIPILVTVYISISFCLHRLLFFGSMRGICFTFKNTPQHI